VVGTVVVGTVVVGTGGRRAAVGVNCPAGSRTSGSIGSVIGPVITSL